MDVTRLPAPISEAHLHLQSSHTVKTIHKSMVSLREELVKKNKRIAELESQLQHTGKTSNKFEDMFELHTNAPTKVKTSQEVDFDQILLYEDTLNQDSEKRNGRISPFDPGPPTEDPIMAFVLSDDEDLKNDVDDRKATRTNSISLVLNQDILVHPPPRSSSDDIRPILKHSNHSRSSSGTQTDITALLQEEKAPRSWTSAPHSLNRVSSVMSSEISRTKSMVTFDERQGQPDVIVEKRDKEASSLQVMLARNSLDLRIRDIVLRPISLTPTGMDIEDTESLLKQADRFVRLAQVKMVTMDDWNDITQKHLKFTFKSPPDIETPLGLNQVLNQFKDHSLP